MKPFFFLVTRMSILINFKNNWLWGGVGQVDNWSLSSGHHPKELVQDGRGKWNLSELSYLSPPDFNSISFSVSCGRNFHTLEDEPNFSHSIGYTVNKQLMFFRYTWGRTGNESPRGRRWIKMASLQSPRYSTWVTLGNTGSSCPRFSLMSVARRKQEFPDTLDIFRGSWSSLKAITCPPHPFTSERVKRTKIRQGKASTCPR